MAEPRVFIDSSVLLAAFAGDAQAQRVVLAAARGRIRAVVSDWVAEEVTRALARRAPAIAPTVSLVLDALQADEVIVPTDEEAADYIGGEPIDGPMIAAAEEGDARYLVTCDPALLDRRQAIAKRHVQALTPAEAAARWR